MFSYLINSKIESKIFLSILVSKENDIDSNASSIDTDMEDNISQDSHQHYDHLSSTTPRASSALLVGRTIDDELNNVSLHENDDYIPNNLSHIHLLHQNLNSTDPNLNHHNTTRTNTITNGTNNNSLGTNNILQYFTDTNNERLKYIQSKSITTPTSSNYDPNSDMNFLYDLVTPPSNPTSIIRQSIQTQSNTNPPHYFDDHQWNA